MLGYKSLNYVNVVLEWSPDQEMFKKYIKKSDGERNLSLPFPTPLPLLVLKNNLIEPEICSGCTPSVGNVVSQITTGFSVYHRREMNYISSEYSMHHRH